ncbi:MAG: YoaK family protein [Gaiellaceae bacterium]
MLTLVAGAVDVTSFIALGKVFASVMTGNMVLLGLAAGTTDAALAIAAGCAFAGYALGALVGANIAKRAKVRRDSSARPLEWALAAEFVALAAFTAGWEMSAGHPDVAAQRPLLVLAAIAMGIQSATVKELGAPGLSTTYMTGTLTGVLAGLASSRHRDSGSGWAVARLAALICGAAVTALLVRHAAYAMPLLPLCALASGAAIVAVGSATERSGPRRSGRVRGGATKSRRLS